MKKVTQNMKICYIMAYNILICYIAADIYGENTSMRYILRKRQMCLLIVLGMI
jgi:hypothetical protein